MTEWSCLHCAGSWFPLQSEVSSMVLAVTVGKCRAKSVVRTKVGAKVKCIASVLWLANLDVRSGDVRSGDVR